MKKIMLIIVSICFHQLIFSQGVKIGGTPTVDPHSILELDGAGGKGLLLPRMTMAQMNAMNAPDGMIVYINDDASLYLRKSAVWEKLAGNNGAGGFTLPHTSVQNVADAYALNITNTAAGNLSGSIKGISTGNGMGVSGFSESGKGIEGKSNTGTGGYFSSTTGYALLTGMGKVGIGTAAPAYPLTVQAEGTGFVHKGASAEIGTSVSALGGQLRTFTNHSLHFSANSNVFQMSLVPTGELGIGTALPYAKVHAKYNNENLLQLDNTNTLADGQNVLQYFKSGSYYTGIIGTYGMSANTARMGFSTGTNMFDYSLVERMSIMNNGNIGINKVNPIAKLDVYGKIKATAEPGADAVLELNGAIKVIGSLQAASVYTATAGMISGNGEYLTIDHPHCNNDPNALVFITSRQNQDFTLYYDGVAGRWKLRSYHKVVSGYRAITYRDCGNNCITINDEMPAENLFFGVGDKFNLLIIKAG